MTNLPQCHSCGGSKFERLIDLGSIPIAHRFLKAPAGPDEFKHPMTLDLCIACGLTQILAPIPPEQLYRDYNFCFSSWKAQPHMADEIALMREKLKPADGILEVGSNDGSFLHELLRAGFTNVTGVEPNSVANELARKSGATIYEGFFDSATARKIKAERGSVSLVVSRQVVEHISSLRSLAEGVRDLLKPGGWLLFEVPDFDVPTRYGDVSALWEEHVNYFTEATMGDFMAASGFKPSVVRRYDFSGGALMILAQRQEAPAGRSAEAAEDGRRTGRAFAARAAQFREKIVRRLRNNREHGRANILYGTGCRANMLVNAFHLAPLIDLIVDDQTEKQGLYLPGTALKIASPSLLAKTPSDCFLAVNSENEPAVIARHAAFEKAGGRFLSLHSPSARLKEIEIEAAPVR